MDRNNVYRNYSSTQQKIAMLNTLRITTREEAIAFLRGVANINAQIADILQRENLAALASRNRVAATTPVEEQKETVASVAVEATEEEVPNFEQEETHTEEEAKNRVAQLKKSKASK